MKALLINLLNTCAGWFMALNAYVDPPPSNSTILNFDDIPTFSGMAQIPKGYNHLVFSSYNAFAPKDPAFDGQISEHDFNCAVSPPNALIGSRSSFEPSSLKKSNRASFKIYNGTSMAEDGLYPYFELLSLYVKPMAAPKPSTRITVIGYSYTGKEPLEWHVDFLSEYHLSFHVKMPEYSGTSWDKLYGVEILADFGDDALDWEFCVDDLEVQFFTQPKKEHRGELSAQAVASVLQSHSDT